MFHEIKGLFRQSFIYTLGSVVQSAVAIILIPLYTRYLTTAEYGAFEIANTALSVLLFLFSLGIPSAILKNYNLDFQNKEQDQKKLIGTAFLFLIPVVVVAEIIGWLNAPVLAQLLFGDPHATTYVHLILLTTLFAVFVNMCFSVLRSKEDSKTYTIFFLTRFVALLFVNIYFLVVRREGVQGLLLGNLLTYILTSILLVPTVLRSATLTINKLYLSKLLAFGLPILPASMAQWFIDLSDRYFLRYYRSLSEVGIYSLGYKVGFLVMIILVTPFQLAWPSISFRLATHPQAKLIYAKVLTYFFLIGLSMTLVLSLFAREIIWVFSQPEFSQASEVVWIVSLSYVLFGAHFVISTGIHIAKKTNFYPFILIGSALLNTLLNIIFIKPYGMLGAAYATLISFVIMFAGTYVVAQKFYPILYEWKRIGILAILFIISLSVGAIIQTDFFVFNVGLKICILIGFVAALFFFKFFDKKEIESLKKFIPFS